MLIDGSLKIGWIQQLLMYPDNGLWFLWALFFITVIFQLCGWMAEKFKVNMAVVVVLVGIALVLFMVLFKIKLFGFQFIAYYFIFYAGAYYFHKYYEKLVSFNKYLVFLMAITWFVLAWFWQMHEIPPFLSRVPIPATIVQYAYRFATAFIAIYVLFAVSPRLLDSANKWNRPLVYLGKISLGIYSINFFVLGHIVPLLKEEEFGYSMTILLSFVLGSICAWAIIWVIAQWKVTERCLLGKI